MNGKQRQRLESFRRIRAFLSLHPPSPRPRRLTAQLAMLATVIERVEQHAATQAHSPAEERRETRERAAMRRHLRQRQMQPIAEIARALAPTHPGINAALTSPRPQTRAEALAIDAEAMATAVAPHAALFVEHGCPPDFVHALRATAAAVRQGIDEGRRLRETRHAASVSIAHELARGILAVRLIDAMVRPRFVDDPERLAAWRDARLVHAASASCGPRPPVPPAPRSAAGVFHSLRSTLAKLAKSIG